MASGRGAKNTGMKYMKIFWDVLDAIQPLGDAERGRLFTALLEYGKTGESPKLSGNERFLFPMLKAQIDRDADAYDSSVESKREAGKKGGLAKASNTKQDLADASICQDMLAEPSKSSKDKDKDKEEDKDKDKEEDKEEIVTIPNGIVCPTGAVERVVSAWNGLGLTQVSRIVQGKQRDMMLKARIREYGLEKVLEAISVIPHCPFLMGNNRNGWQITIDWFIRPNNFPKVLDGNYLENAGHSGNPFKNISVEDW